MSDGARGGVSLCALLACLAGRALAADGCAAPDAAPFSAPAFAPDARDPARHGAALYVETNAGAPARGGLERLTLRADGTIVGARGASAIDDQGRIRSATGRDWASDARPAPLYTDLVPGPLLAAANEVSEANSALGAAELGLAPQDAGARAALLREARSAAAGATRSDDSGVEVPRPLVLATPAGAVVLLASPDGLLRAVDALSGAPLWSFAPRDRLGRPGAALAGHQPYPGSLSVIRVGTGYQAPRRLGVFAGGAGSSSYVGFDLSDPRHPKFLWRVRPEQLPGAARRRAPATLARIRIAGLRGPAESIVVVAAGGEDAAETGRAVAPRRGNRIYLLDAGNGALLWHAGPAAPARDADPLADLKLARLDAPLAAATRVLDLDGDGYADRIYAADVAGRIWRFDIHNGADAQHLITGGVWASLGGADFGGGAHDARRFAHPPDAALLREGAEAFVQVAIGSAGGAPGAQDFFYALRDYEWRARDAAANGPGGWNAARVLRNGSPFADAGAAPAAGRSPGWRLALGHGESVDGTARTFAGAVLFTTASGEGRTPCAVARRLYALDARTGATLRGRDAPWVALPPSPHALPVAFAFPAPAPGAPAGCTAGAAGCAPAAVCLIGLVGCGPLPALRPIRAVWSELGDGR